MGIDRIESINRAANWFFTKEKTYVISLYYRPLVPNNVDVLNVHCCS